MKDVRIASKEINEYFPKMKNQFISETSPFSVNQTRPCSLVSEEARLNTEKENEGKNKKIWSKAGIKNFPSNRGIFFNFSEIQKTEEKGDKNFNTIVIEEAPVALEGSNQCPNSPKGEKDKTEKKDKKRSKKKEKLKSPRPRPAILKSSIRRPSIRKSTFKNNERELNKKRLGLRRLKSSASLFEYFNEDSQDTDKLLQLNDPYFYHEHTVTFSLPQYLEALTIHILGYFTLGPLVNLYPVLFWGNRYLMYNMQFFRNSSICYIQYAFCLVAWVSYYVIFFTDSEVGDLNSFVTLVLMFSMRISSISGKYATYPKNLMKKVRHKKLTLNEIQQELMLIGWADQSPEIMMQEIDSSFKRQEIDDPLFKMSFIGTVSDGLRTRFKEIESKQPGGGFTVSTLQQPTKRQLKTKFEYFDSKILFEFLLLEFKKENSKEKCLIEITRTMDVFMLTFTAPIIRYFYDQSVFGGNIWEIIFFVVYSKTMWNLARGFIIFFGNSLTDMGRKAWLLRQLGHMISSKRTKKIHAAKLLPTINLVDQVSLNSWISMRKLCIDYGKKYYKRHEIFLPVVFIVAMIASFIFIVLYFFDLPVDDHYAKEISKGKAFIICYFSYFMFIFFYLLFMAGAINDQFEQQINILKKNKQVYRDLLIYKEFYFQMLFQEDCNKNKNQGKYIGYKYDVVAFKDQKSQSFVHRRLVREIMKVVDGECLAFVEDYLENIIAVNDSCIEQLEDEQRFNALKILGFTVTTSVVFNLMFALISVALTCYEILAK